MVPTQSNRRVIDLSSTTEWTFLPIGGTLGGAPHQITVPGGGWYAQGFDCDSGIYERWITIPDLRLPKVIKLEFEAINFISDIYLGKDRNSLIHIQTVSSSWMPVIVDITGLVSPGKSYLLRVCVRGREACSVVNNGYREYIVPEGANWTLTMDSGILRGVYLRLYPLTYVQDIFARPSVSSRSLAVDARVENRTGQNVQAELRFSLIGQDGARWEYPEISPSILTLNPGELTKITVDSIAWNLGETSYWWPNVPYWHGYKSVLHNLCAELRSDGQIVDKHVERFGFREFTYHGQNYYLNGIRCNLRGHNQTEADFNGGTNHSNDAYGTWPGFLPPSERNGGWPQAVDNYLRMNANVIRVHQIPATRYMLDVCDEMGLMVIAESSIRGDNSSWTYQQENQRLGHDNMCQQVRDMVKRDRNHPSIVVWSVANEPWVGREYTDEFMLELDDIAKREDPTRIKIVDGALDDYEGDIVAVKHYWPLDDVVTWPNKPNGLGEYGSLVTEAAILKTIIMTVCCRLDGRIADLRPWHITHAWCGHILGVRRSDIFMEGNSVIYKKIIKDSGKFNHLTKYPEFEESMERQLDCKQVINENNIFPYLEDDAPWGHWIIQLLQNMFNPCAAFDKTFWMDNLEECGNSEWNSYRMPVLQPGQYVQREIAVFNDTLAARSLTFKWEVRQCASDGPVLAGAEETLRIDASQRVDRPIQFQVPFDCATKRIYLLLDTFLDNVMVFHEMHFYFQVHGGPKDE